MSLGWPRLGTARGLIRVTEGEHEFSWSFFLGDGTRKAPPKFLASPCLGKGANGCCCCISADYFCIILFRLSSSMIPKSICRPLGVCARFAPSMLRLLSISEALAEIMSWMWARD